MGKQVQIKLSDKAEEIVAVFKVRNNLRTKAEAINIILERYVVD